MAAISASSLVIFPFGLQQQSQLTTQHIHHHKFMIFPAPPKLLSRKCSSNPFIAYALSSDSSWEREETRWLREEKRWLREEARWLKEEARWNAEREALEEQISSLREEIRDLQDQQQEITALKEPSSAPLTKLSSLMSQLLLQARKGVELNESSSSPPAQISIHSSRDFHTTVRPTNSLESSIFEEKSAQKPELSVDLEDSKKQASSGKQVVKDILTSDPKEKKQKKRRTLKRGSEGEDVKEMQGALERLGFYSGEEDMEYSMYAGDTESAVKSWQATIGALEDGMMTEELLAKLLGEEMPSTSIGKGLTNNSSVPSSEKEVINGPAHIPVVAKVAKIQQTIKSDPEGVEVSERRVYLLGENRWEEPQRLVDKRRGTKVSKCFTCKGEGTTLCTECEGTGDLNVEEQFLDWVQEGAGCPYCEGLGYLVCDMCQGKGEEL